MTEPQDDDLDTYIAHWRAAFDRTLTREEALEHWRAEAEFYAALRALASEPVLDPRDPAED
jgi:hypothetical protein